MPTTRTTNIAVANLSTAEKYFDHFEAEMHTDTTGNARVAIIDKISGFWNSGTSRFDQRSIVYFKNAALGTTYQFRFRVIDKAGNIGSWSGWISEVAGDSIAPSPTYAVAVSRSPGGITVRTNPSGAASDTDHYEIFRRLNSATAPSATDQGHGNSPDGVFYVGLDAYDTATLWVRSVDTSGNRQAWQSLGTFNSFGSRVKAAAGFDESFDDDIRNIYLLVAGSGASVTYPSNGQSGGKVLNTGGKYLWYEYQVNIPFDPSKMYRIKARVRKTAGIGNTTFYCGVAGVAADGTTLVNVSGVNDHASQHYVSASAVNVPNDSVWREYTGYLKGTAATGSGNPSTDINNPAKLHQNVRYFRPLFILGYNVDGDTYEIDQVTIDIMPTSLLDIGDDATFRRTSASYVDSSNRPTALRRASSDLAANDISRQDEVTSHIGGLGVATIGLETKVTDGTTRRALVKGSSTALNEQGNIPASSFLAAPFTFNKASHAGGAVGVIKVTWAAFTLRRADGSTISIPASSALSVPAAPTLSQVALGAIAARTYFVRVALVKAQTIAGISGESSLAVSANNVLKVTSPTSVAGYDGWIPLISGFGNPPVSGVTNAEKVRTEALPSAPIAFGTDFTEPSTGLVDTSSSAFWSDDSSLAAGAQGLRAWTTNGNGGLAANASYFAYPYLDVANTLVSLMDAANTAKSDVQAIKQSGDGNIALSNGAVTATMPAAGGSGSNTGGEPGGRGTP